MSVGRNLQEMENVVTKGAAPSEPMPKLTTGIPPGQTGSWEDLGGPTVDNYRPDDDSSKLKDPAAILKQVRNVVNQAAAPAEKMREESDHDDEEVIDDSVEEYDEEDVVSEGSHEDDEEDDEDDDKNDDDAPHGKGGKKKKKVEEEFDIEEDVNALLAGEELSEEFQEKARTIFEAAIRTRVAEVKEYLQSEYETALIEEIENVKIELVERVDAYLEYVADEWITENALAVETGLKTEMTESFLNGMKQLFEDHYVTIPEDRYDVVESMVDKLDEMETKLNEQIEKNVALNRRLAESVTDVIFAEISEGLALSQKDKLASLAENVEFDGEENYREKLVTLRESYFPSRPTSTQRDHSETLSEGMTEYDESVSGVMEAYLQTLGRVSKK